jgi:GNAT superfamily N-acetyltransferase
MLSIRPATANDAILITTLIRELAEYEHLSHEVGITEEDVLRDGFGSRPRFRAIIAEWDGQVAGYALFFEVYSSFQGRAGLLLEDLFVRSQYRSKGVGKALLARLAEIALREKYSYLRWEVLGWNTPAIEFYKKLGGIFLDEWKVVFLLGDALQAVAGDAK